MPLSVRLVVGVAALGLAVLTGCDKNESSQLARARADLGSSRSQAARNELKNAIQTHPKSGEARYLYGDLLLREGDAAAAAIELQRALEYRFSETLVLPRLAEALVLSNRPGLALANYADVNLPEAQAQARLLAALAMAAASAGDDSRAQDFVDKALRADAASTPALLMKVRLMAARNDLPGGLSTLDELLGRQPDNPEAWTLKGDLLMRQPEGLKSAITAFQNVLKVNPDHAYAHATLITLHLAQGDLDSARQQHQRLRKLAPNSVSTAMLEGHIAYASGQHERAREIYLELLRVLPENLNLLLSAGENEMKLGTLLQAESYLAKATALAPRNPLARRLLGEAQLRQGQAPRALVTLAPLVDAPDAGAEVLALAAQARLLNGERRAADALYSRLAKLKPSDPRLRTILANAGFGRLGDAAVFQELRSIASTDTGTSADLAIISAHLQRKQFDEALQALQTLARKRPDDPMVPQLRGQVMSARNDLPAARQSFEEALRLSPGYFPAVAALAVLDLKQGQAAAARQRFDTLLKTQPKNATAMLALSEVMAREAAPRAAIRKQIEAAIKAAPADMEARLALVNHHLGTGDFDTALGSALTAASALPDNIELLELVARCQLQLRQYGQALASYGKIIGLQPKSPRGHLGAAAVYLATDDLDQAQRAIQRALELAPGLPQAQDQAVALALRRQQPARALEIARQMQADRPDSAAGWLAEADIEIKRGNWAAAVPPLRRALEKADPGIAARQLHQALLEAGKPAEAESFAAQWLQHHALDTEFLFQLGDSAQARGHAARAEQRYEAVLAIDPDHALALNNLAMLRLQLKKPGARDLAEHALRMAPDRPALLDTLAQAHASENNLSRAIELQQRVVALAPDDGVMRLTLARYLLESGDKARARAELEKLAALGPQFGQQAEVSQMLQPLLSSLVKR